jgi:hypothetical protein
MAQQNCSVPRTIKMKGFSRADLNRQPLKPDCINKKSAGCIDMRHTGAKKPDLRLHTISTLTRD